MKPFFLVLTLLISFSYSSMAAPRRLLMLGDSITEGYGVSKEAAYPALLEKKIKAAGKDWLVINAGISGSTTASGPGRIKWQLKQKPEMMLLALGANDGLRGLKVSESEKNLSETIELAQNAHVKVILAGMLMPPNYGEQYRKEFSAMYDSVAKKYKLLKIPFLLDGVAGHPELNQADGIHPNEKGHVILAESVFKALKELL